MLSVTEIDGAPAEIDEQYSDLSIGEVWLNRCDTGGYVRARRRRLRLNVTYQAGRDPVPEDVKTAMLIIVGHLWDTQRGRSGSRAGVMGLDDDAPIGGDASYLVLQGYALPRRAMELLRPYMQVTLP